MNYCAEIYLSAAEKNLSYFKFCMGAEKIINIQTWHQREYGIKRGLKVISCDAPSTSNTQ